MAKPCSSLSSPSIISLVLLSCSRGPAMCQTRPHQWPLPLVRVPHSHWVESLQRAGPTPPLFLTCLTFVIPPIDYVQATICGQLCPPTALTKRPDPSLPPLASRLSINANSKATSCTQLSGPNCLSSEKGANGHSMVRVASVPS